MVVFSVHKLIRILNLPLTNFIKKNYAIVYHYSRLDLKLSPYVILLTALFSFTFLVVATIVLGTALALPLFT